MRIAIVGYGIEGESNYRYWSHDRDNEISIVDECQPERLIPEGAKTIIGPSALDDLDGFDLVVRSAGWSPRKIKTDSKVWSATNEFFARCPARIIGVTGSKGKGTTSGIITSILEASGRRVWLVGNIGKPALDVLDQISSDDIVVYELSSFQLWDINYSPNIAVVLFIEQEHLDVHTDMEEYIRAKSNITRYQTADDLLIYNGANQFARTIADQSAARLVDYTDGNKANVKNSNFYYDEQFICSIGELHLIGEHNLQNACAAIDAVWDIVSDSVVIKSGLSEYKGLPHRLQFVRELDSVKYYDDSIATTPSSAIAALRSFTGDKVLILGGSSKGSNYTELGLELTRHNVKALLIGDESKVIASACDRAGFNDYEVVNFTNMTELVEKARSLSRPGGVILLSPASASFGLFRNYTDRGEQFTEAVNGLN